MVAVSATATPRVPANSIFREAGGPGTARDEPRTTGSDANASPTARTEPGAGAAGDAVRAVAEQPSPLRLYRELASLRRRDAEVHAHELAHKSVAGRYAGATRFSYTRGPDGVLYAVAGEVAIDISPVPGDPEATLAKAQQVARAALAPRDPSSTDRRIAAIAQRIAADAREEIASEAASERAARRRENESARFDENPGEDRLGTRVDTRA